MQSLIAMRARKRTPLRSKARESLLDQVRKGKQMQSTRTSPSYSSRRRENLARTGTQSMGLLVNLILARYGILPLSPEEAPAPARAAGTAAKARTHSAPARQGMLFPVS
jgi:hypothetical protein